MKKHSVILLILSIFSCTSCDFSLVEHPYSTGGDMINSSGGANQMVTAIYNVFWSSELMKKSYMETVDMDHDHAAAPTWVVSGAGEGNMTTHWSYNTASDPFNAFYRIINRANYAIENLPLVKDTTDNLVGQYMGYAFFATRGGQRGRQREHQRQNQLIHFHIFVWLKVCLKFSHEMEIYFAQAGWELLPVARGQSLYCLVKTSSTDNT